MINYDSNPFDFISDSELDSLPLKYGPLNNPIYYLFGNEESYSSDNSRELLADYTKDCINIIKKKDNDFFNRNKKRLMNTKDYSNVSSTLGEIRCYAELIKLFPNVFCNDKGSSNNPKADFAFDFKGKTCYVEVNTPQINSETKRYEGELEKLQKYESKIVNVRNGIGTKVHSTAPYGRNNCENLRENVISRLCRVKQEEHQVNSGNLNVLWIDLNDEKMSLIRDTGMFKHSVKYVEKFGDWGIYPNLLWYSTYGKKGCYIFNGEPEYQRFSSICKMKHNGRFFIGSKSKFSIIVYSLPQKNIIMVNPNLNIDDEILSMLKSITYFDDIVSVIYNNRRKLKNVIKKEYRRINNYYKRFKKKGIYRFYKNTVVKEDA